MTTLALSMLGHEVRAMADTPDKFDQRRVDGWTDHRLGDDPPAAYGTDGQGSGIVRLGYGTSGFAVIGSLSAMVVAWQAFGDVVKALTEEAAWVEQPDGGGTP